MAKALLAALAAACLAGAALAGDDSAYELTGVGGAGGIFNCAGSPVDPNFMLVSCDMSGCYRSYDGGRTWRIINWTYIHAYAGDSQCLPYFHPKNDKIAVWWGWITTDKALTWKPLAEGKAPWGDNGTIRHVACSADAAPAVYVGSTGGFWGSTDGLKTWKQYGQGACGGVQILDDNTAYAAIGGSLYRWQAGKTEPERVETPGVQGAIHWVAAGGAAGSHTVHLATPGGVYTSNDSSKTWRLSQQQSGIAAVVMARNQEKAAYSCDRMKVYVTTDGGGTWTSTFKLGGNGPLSWVQRDMYWDYYIVPGGLGCGQGTPGLVTMTTQAELFISNDYGKTWEFRHTKELGAMPGGGTRCQSVGLEVTGSWCYYIDPNDMSRHYAGYSDFGFMRSIDGGKTWSRAMKGSPWGNTVYQVAFDPFQKGRLYAAATTRHEIIHWICCTPTNDPGGVIISDDCAESWKPVTGGGLPLAPCTSVVVDAKSSKPGAVVLYAAFWGQGVYKSTDSGATWTKKPGVGRPGNCHVFQIRIHPKTNDVYCNVSANRSGSTFAVAGGLWKSSDGGDNWTEITGDLNLKWLNGYSIHPENPGIVYVTGAATPGAGGGQGGVYRTTDGGATWKRLLKDADFAGGYVHGLFVDLNPADPNVVYFSGTEGLWASPDAGEHWRLLDEIPFKIPHRVVIDPRLPGTMFVCTDGAGIVVGPVLKGVPGEKPAAGASSSRSGAPPKPKEEPASEKPKPAAPAPAPAGPSEKDVAAAKAAEAALRKAVTDGVAAGKREQVYIDLMGRPARAQLTGANDDGIEVQSSGMQSAVKWSALSPKRFYGVAKKYSEDHKALAAYCRGNGLAEEAAEEERSQ